MTITITFDLPERPKRPKRLCLVCHRARLVDPMLDAIGHAQCDQRLTALDPDTPGEPSFWGSIGRAAYDG